MSRVFKRGELQLALLDVLSRLGTANGYAIMQAVAGHVRGWRPTPGAIYPALLGLEDAGLIRGNDGTGGRVYELTASGSAALGDAGGTLERVAARMKAEPQRPTAGAVLDEFVGSLAGRLRRLPINDEADLRALLDSHRDSIEAITTRGLS